MKKFFNIFSLTNINNLFFLLSFYIFFLCLIIQATFLSTFLYKISLKLFNIPNSASLSKIQILNDYNEIINYIINIKHNSLTLENFILSDKANYHFYEVKQVFNFINFIFIICSLLTLIYLLIFYTFNKRLDIILNRICNFIIYSTLFLCIICILNFNFVFELMHNIVFNNNYWLFDPKIDPIIIIFPKEFFIVCIFFGFFLLFVLIYFLKSLSKYIYAKSNLCK